MKFSNTIQVLQKLGSSVVDQGRKILTQDKKQTSSNTLYKDFDYTVTSKPDSVSLEWEFGKAEDYWIFVDQGVRGTNQPDDNGYRVPGKQRGQGSPFKYTTKMPPRGAIDRWIVRKPLKQARKKGKFIKRKTFAFFIQRSIFQRGLQRTLFFSTPYEQQLQKYDRKILDAVGEDIETELINLLNI